ncbi:hypothetical protein Tco_0598556 [Tanacetum coccineum]
MVDRWICSSELCGGIGVGIGGGIGVGIGGGVGVGIGGGIGVGIGGRRWESFPVVGIGGVGVEQPAACGLLSYQLG